MNRRFFLGASLAAPFVTAVPAASELELTPIAFGGARVSGCDDYLYRVGDGPWKTAKAGEILKIHEAAIVHVRAVEGEAKLNVVMYE